MRLRDVGLTKEEIKAKVDKYMIETYERFDMIAERGKGMYVYDENGTPYLDFYAGIAVNSAGSCNDKVVLAVIDQCWTSCRPSTIRTRSRRPCWLKRFARPSAWTRFSSRTPAQKPTKP
ncbi:aminotransferase class III-fold pyridoxal phosphate-dependent enzyme [Megasphaera sp.]|uniref:aminotransferase class III-fold pyridoxal phosphate-dependent enzyme n=1 Tax=Megasphaera sp. TaxID=2023260 RepID=UPI00352298E0